MLLVAAATACSDPTAIRLPPDEADDLVVVAAFDAADAFQVVWVQALGGQVLQGPLTVEVFHGGDLVASATRPEGASTDISTCVGGFGQSIRSEGECLVLPFWPVPDREYDVRVSAPDRPTARASVRILRPTALERLELSGSPPSHLSARWTPVTGSHRYVVSVLGRSSLCTDGCATGWSTTTGDTSYDGLVDETALRDALGGSFVVQVQALDRALWEYFTTGATGSVFVVPPKQNVEGGHGVVGSRSRARSDFRPTLERGAWELLSLPPAEVEVFVLDPALEGVVYAAGDTAVVRSNDGGRTWSTELVAGALDPLLPRPALTVTPDGVALVGRGPVLFARHAGTGQWVEAATFDAPINALAPLSGGLLAVTVDPADLRIRLYRAPAPSGPWVDLPFPATTLDLGALSVQVAEVSPTELWVGVPRDARVYRSDDGGDTWDAAAGPSGQLRSLIAGPSLGLLAGTEGASGVRGTWLRDPATSSGWRSLNDAAAVSLALDPVRPERLWIGDAGTQRDATDPPRVRLSDRTGLSPVPTGFEGGRPLGLEVDGEGRWVYLLAQVGNVDFPRRGSALLRLPATWAPSGPS